MRTRTPAGPCRSGVAGTADPTATAGSTGELPVNAAAGSAEPDGPGASDDKADDDVAGRVGDAPARAGRDGDTGAPDGEPGDVTGGSTGAGSVAGRDDGSGAVLARGVPVGPGDPEVALGEPDGAATVISIGLHLPPGTRHSGTSRTSADRVKVTATSKPAGTLARSTWSTSRSAALPRRLTNRTVSPVRTLNEETSGWDEEASPSRPHPPAKVTAGGAADAEPGVRSATPVTATAKLIAGQCRCGSGMCFDSPGRLSPASSRDNDPSSGTVTPGRGRNFSGMGRRLHSMRIGAHVDAADPLAEAAGRSADLVQFFLSDPQGWASPQPRPDADALLGAEVDRYVHAPYVINVATLNNRIRIPSRKLLASHAAAAATIGAKALIVHGGHVNKGDDLAAGIANWRKTFQYAADGGGYPIRVLIENTAGGDNACARRLDTLARLWDAIGEFGPGFCLDTCHAHAAGEELLTVVDRIMAITGRIDLVHANNSKDAFASGRDRHDNLESGTIDADLIVAVIRAAGAPVVVETPGGAAGQAADITYLRERAGA